MTTAILKITNGTDEITFIAKGFGFHLSNWRPQRPGIKQGGVRQDSILTSGSRLTWRKFEDIVDVYELKMNEYTPDNAARSMGALLDLLEKSVNYWVGAEDTPVWLEARAKDETNTRYALLKDYSFPEDENPFSQPFLQPGCNALMDGLQLSLTHSIWQSEQPDESTGVPSSVRYSFNPVINYSFENWSGGVPVGWTSTGSPVLTQSTDDVVSGLYSCEVENNLGAGVNRGIYQDITAVTNGESYTYTVNVYVEDLGTGGAGIFLIAWDGGGFLNAVADVAGSLGAQTLSVTKTAVSTGIRVAVICNANNAIARWDDVVQERYYGNIDSLDDRVEETDLYKVFAANLDERTNITHIYNYDDSAGTYSDNLIDSARPTTLFPAGAAALDSVFIGIEASAANFYGGPFNSLYFDIVTPASSTTSYSIGFYYYNGATFASPTPNTHDLSLELSETGLVTWDMPTNQTVTTINGVAGYWIKIQLTPLVGVFTNPTIGIRPYRVATNWLEVQEDNVGGDVPALLKSINHYLLEGTHPINGILVGLRSLSRGEDFRSIISVSRNQSDANISVSKGGGAVWANDDEIASAVSYAQLTVATPNTEDSTVATVTITGDLAQQYVGRFNLIVRCNLTGTNPFLSARISTANTILAEYFETDRLSKSGSSFYSVYDIEFGEITIPVSSSQLKSEIQDVKIQILLTTGSTAATADVFSIALLPTDEFYSRFDGASSGTSIDREILIDSTNSKRIIRATLTEQNGNYGFSLNATNPGPYILQNAERQRLHFYLYDSANSLFAAMYDSMPYMITSATLAGANRYLTMRGDRS